MKNKCAFIVALLAVLPVSAATIEILNPTGKSVFQKQASLIGQESIGSFSLRILNAAQALGEVKFTGDEDGIEMINGFSNDTKVISNTEIKAFGWCFSVNRTVPQTMANETPMTNEAAVVWFYGYAYYKNGGWQPGCVPAWK